MPKKLGADLLLVKAQNRLFCSKIYAPADCEAESDFFHSEAKDGMVPQAWFEMMATIFLFQRFILLAFPEMGVYPKMVCL